MSKYFDTLSQQIRDRYISKIGTILNYDPYTLTSSSTFLIKIEDFPKISYMDIVTYYTLTYSFYTGKQLKAVKSLQAYKYFEAGFVSNIMCFKIGKNYLIKAKVKHSQKMNDQLLLPWLIVYPDGAISSTHCTCPAGCGEVCSHSAAVCFELFFKYSSDIVSCTEKKSKWNVPSKSKKIDFDKIKDINMGKPIKSQTYCDAESIHVPTMDDEESMNFLKIIDNACSSAGILSTIEPFANARTVHINDHLPAPLTNLYKLGYCSYSLEELQEIDVDFSISEKQQKAIEKATIKQSKSFDWFKHKGGRVSSSNFKSCCNTSIQNPSNSLIKQICYPSKIPIKKDPLNYGIDNEEKAKVDYEIYMKQHHQNFQLKQTGFVISLENPIFGASPDALISCDCCGNGCLEIKCPYRMEQHSLNLKEFAKLNDYLINVDGKFSLDRTHAYYFQTQLQMYVLKRKFCDFVIWSKKEIFIERIYFCLNFIEINLKKASIFHNNVIKPELLARWYTQPQDCELQIDLSEFFTDQDETTI